MPLLSATTDPVFLIDSRNEKLWNELLSHYNITIAASGNLEHGCYTEGDIAIIYCPAGDHNKGSFTHELLHIYLRHINTISGRTWLQL